MTRAHLSFFLLLLVFTAGFRPALAQRSVEDRITDRLVDRGFESVHVASVDGRLEVEFENRVFRYDVTAMQEAAEIVFSTTGAPDGLTLVPLRRGVRLASVRLNREGYLSLRRETAEPDEAPSIISARTDVPVRTYERGLSEIFSGGRNSSSFKLDVAVHPQLVAQFGSFSDAVRSQINLVPAASINLWYGMQLYGEVIVPVQNDLDEADDEVRPGIISANQTLRLPGGVFVSASAGAFTRDRYGFDFEVLSSFIDGRIDVLGRIGRTGYA
ncbi:MAG: hypothetical protein HKN17_04760, partial [Rhodothermales bacterium]|nr:hypothetical protein [Rhodothermales bacterium]